MIYDSFCFFNELDLLEARFNILDEHVDRFILCESLETFSGKPKPLYYQENKQRFELWNHKITHLIAPKIETDDSFERAAHQKDFIRKSLLLKAEDILYFGDVDEIWTPQDVDDEVYNLQQLCYSYYFNRRSSEEWVGTVAGKWKTIKTQTLNHWRATHTFIRSNGGWHFTNLGGPEQLLKKLDAYDHQEFNTDEIKRGIARRMERGEDYVGRSYDWQGKPFRMWVDEEDLPEYLLKNRDKYAKHFFA